MQAKSFFGGLVQIKPLQLTDKPAARPEVRARLASPKGEMAVLADTGQIIRHLTYLELRPAQRRGEHYHKIRREYFYLISGEASLLLEEIATKSKISLQINPGDLVLLQPGIAHVFNPLTSGQAIEFAAEPFDPSDVYPHTINGP
jgi:mannose-6-phosphate isomerase-like protein (cupin superfamily)